jgi:cytochrome P450
MFGNIKAGSFYRAADYYQTVRSLLWRFVPKGLDENRKMHMRMSTEKARQRLKMDSGRTDLVSRMTKPDSGISEPEFIANTSLLIIAGSETTATLLSGITYYLVQNPRVLEKLVYDVRSTFSSDQEINFVNVSRLKYMLACLDEAFRMYPPVPGNLPRKTNVPETLFDKFVPANVGIFLV